MKKLSIQLLELLGFSAFRLTLDFVYASIAEEFDLPFYGYFYSPGKLSESYFINVVLISVLIITAKKILLPSRLASVIYFLVVITPMLTLYGFGVDIASLVFMRFVSVSFLVFVSAIHLLPKISLPKLTSEFYRISLALAILITIYVYASLVYEGGLQRLNLNLLTVYDTRENLKFDFPLMEYFLFWQAYVINMSFLGIALYKQRKQLVLLAVAAQVLLFAMTNFKSFLFVPVLVVIILKISRNKKIIFYMTILLTSFLLLALQIDRASGDIILNALFAKRVFFLPATLHFEYYNFFSINPKILLSNSFLSPFIDNPYSEPVARIISRYYLHGVNGSANVGYLGDAYAHFGFPGMIIFSVVLATFFKVIDGLALDLPLGVATSLTIIPSFVLTNSAMFTTMMTHGFLAAMLSLWVLRKPMRKIKSKDI
jgi:hypothetical protein